MELMPLPQPVKIHIIIIFLSPNFNKAACNTIIGKTTTPFIMVPADAMPLINASENNIELYP